MSSRTFSIVCAALTLMLVPRRVDAQLSGPGIEQLPTPSPFSLSATLAGMEEAAQQPDAKEKKPEGFRFVMTDRPSFRFGDAFRIDLRVKFHGDSFRGYDPPFEKKAGKFEVRRERVGVDGNLFRAVAYEVEYEFDEGEDHPWKDSFVNFRYFSDFQVKAGKYKVPFSREQMTGVANLDFVYRSMLATHLAPGRDIGIMLHGSREGIGYEAGLFRQDGEIPRTGEREKPIGKERTFAGRVTARPLRGIRAFQNLEVGTAVTVGHVPEGRSGLAGETAFGTRFFDRVFVLGRRLRWGAELGWEPGPFSLRGEYVRVRDQRHEQGLRGDDLPDVLYEGWFISGTWAVTGQSKAGGLGLRNREFPLQGFGAVELAGRYEDLVFGSVEHTGTPFRNPRAANLLTARNPTRTIGVNWYANRFTKIQLNAVFEDVKDTDRAPIIGRSDYRSWVLRVQLAM